jgi:hypothetical protein
MNTLNGIADELVADCTHYALRNLSRRSDGRIRADTGNIAMALAAPDFLMATLRYDAESDTIRVGDGSRNDAHLEPYDYLDLQSRLRAAGFAPAPLPVVNAAVRLFVGLPEGWAPKGSEVAQ